MTEEDKTPLESINETLNDAQKEMDEMLSMDDGKESDQTQKKVEEPIAGDTVEKEKNIPSASEDKTPDNKKTEPTVPEKKEEKKEPAKKNNTAAVVAGISDAYAGEMKATPQKTKEKSSSSWPKPPARGKNDIKVADGKDIMEVFWNEMWALYDKILDFVVDTALDFVVFVLYPEKPASGHEKKNEKADAFAAGEQAYNSQIQKIRKQKAHAIAVHKEIKDNLQKTINGGNVEWKLLKQEPDFYSKLVEIKRKALNDPNSPEAKMMSEFEKMPETFEQMAEKCEKLTKIAVSLATMNEYMNPKTKDEEIKQAKETYKNNSEECKKKIAEIEAKYKDPKKEQEKMAEAISINTEKYYNTIMRNISTIREKNEDNPQKIQEELKEYMDSIKKSLSETQSLVYETVYKKGKDSKKNKEQAVKKLAEAVNTVNRTTDLQKIALILATMEEFLNPSAKAAEIEEAKKQYTGQEQKNKLEAIEKEYRDPEILKKKTSIHIKNKADQNYKKMKEQLDNIERTHANNPEEKKKALAEYVKQVSETLEETRKKVYLKKGSNSNAYLNDEMDRLDNGESKKTAEKENINAHGWSTDGILNMVKDNYTLSK